MIGLVRSPRDPAGHHHASHAGLFALALGYFGCYVPYSAISKALTSTRISGTAATDGLTLLPVMVVASLLSMIVSISVLGWWRYARPAGGGLPRPNRWTLLSGLATAVILVTTTLAYTFENVSIPFVMLMMRGGVLVLAPIIDAMTGRTVRWFSWIALALSLISLLDALRTSGGTVPLACALDIALYLGGYFVRLRLMARLGKSDDVAVRRRYFVEEQMVATPAAIGLLLVVVAVAPPYMSAPLRAGLAPIGTTWLPWAILAGVCSQGTGVFGALMLLDPKEASFCVPLNRAASILAGVLASATLAVLFAAPPPSLPELFGASLLVGAILVLFYGPRVGPRAT